jgi:hypothetical protein
MRRFFSVYQYLGPAVLLPLAYWLWYRQSGRHDFVAIVVALPVLFQYILPAIGTNVLGLWEIDTRVRAGKFRPHHGFVFGAATAMLAFLVTAPGPPTGLGFWDLLRASLVMASVLGFWNWLYDILAVRSGHIRLYTQAYADGRCAAAMVGDHAPVYFGTFGAVYGIAIEVARSLLVVHGRGDLALGIFLASAILCLTLPVLGYMGQSYLHYGHSGLRSFKQAHAGNG